MSGVISDNLGRSSGLIKAAGGGGKTLNVIAFTNSTRATNTTVNEATWFDETYTQIQANSKIKVEAMIPGFSESSAAMGMQIVYDSTTYTGRGMWHYNTGTVKQNFVLYLAYFDGSSTTGSKTFQLVRKCADTDTARPFIIVNPNTTDDPRVAQTTSTCIITEYDM